MISNVLSSETLSSYSVENLDIISLSLSILSAVVSVISLIYAIQCNKSTKKTNTETSNLLSDIQYITTFNLRIVNELQQRANNNSLSSPILSLEKDKIEVHKLTTFDIGKSEKVMELFSSLRIKNGTINYLWNFLNSDRKDCSVNFCSNAETIDNTQLDFICIELIKYGILVDFYYNK